MIGLVAFASLAVLMSLVDTQTEVWEAVTAISTALLFFTAIVAGWVAWRQLREAAELRRDEYRAYVIVVADISINEHLGWIEVRNVGRTHAEAIAITFEPPLVGPYDEEGRRIGELALWRGIPSLPPGRSMRTLWGSTVELAKAAQEGRIPSSFVVTIRYRSPAVAREYTEQTPIDLNVYWGLEDVRRKGIHEAAETLDKIKGELAGIRAELKRRNGK